MKERKFQVNRSIVHPFHFNHIYFKMFEIEKRNNFIPVMIAFVDETSMTVVHYM